jgi:hypothetical protein
MIRNLGNAMLLTDLSGRAFLVRILYTFFLNGHEVGVGFSESQSFLHFVAFLLSQLQVPALSVSRHKIGLMSLHCCPGLTFCQSTVIPVDPGAACFPQTPSYTALFQNH